MSTPSLATEAALAGGYPQFRFNQRERKLLASVKTYVDSLSPDTVITTEGDLIVGDSGGSAIRLAKGTSGFVLVAGASTVSYAAIVNANVSASAAIAYSKLALSNSIVAGDITSGAVTLAKLSATATYTHRAVAAGLFTTVGGDATESITAAAVQVGDVVHVTVNTVGGTPRTVVASVAAAGAITVTLSGDPSTDHVLNYTAFRAAS